MQKIIQGSMYHKDDSSMDAQQSQPLVEIDFPEPSENYTSQTNWKAAKINAYNVKIEPKPKKAPAPAPDCKKPILENRLALIEQLC